MMIILECEQMVDKLGQKKLEVRGKGSRTILWFYLFMVFLRCRYRKLDDD